MDDRELDARVATEFLGWHTEIIAGDPIWFSQSDDFISHDNFKPSTDPVSCSLVLDEIERREWNWELSYKWNSNLMVIYGWKDPSAESEKMVKVYAKVWHDNRYRAICEAALQAAEADGGRNGTEAEA